MRAAPESTQRFDPQQASHWRVGLPVWEEAPSSGSQRLLGAIKLIGATALLIPPTLALGPMAFIVQAGLLCIEPPMSESRKGITDAIMRPLGIFERLAARISPTYRQLALHSATSALSVKELEEALALGASPLRSGKGILGFAKGDAFDTLAHAYAGVELSQARKSWTMEEREKTQQTLDWIGHRLRSAAERQSIAQAAPGAAQNASQSGALKPRRKTL